VNPQVSITAAMRLLEGQNIDGLSLLMTGNDTFIRGSGDESPVVLTTVTANPTAGTNVIQVVSTSGISIGDRIAFRLGDNPYDNFESPIYAATALVLGISGNNLTLDRIIPYSINFVGATNNKHVEKHLSYLHDARIRDVFLDGSGSNRINGGITLFWVRNLVFERIVGNMAGGLNMGYGLVGLLQYCENIEVRGASLYRNENTTSESSLGRMFNFASCHGVNIYDAICNDVQNNFAFVEDYCEDVRFFNPTIRHFNNPSGQVLFSVLVSKVYVENLRVEMPNSYDMVGYGSTFADPFTKARFRNMSLRGVLPRIMPAWPDVNGRVDYSDGTNTFAIDIDAASERTLTISLSAGMHTYFSLDPGFLLSLSIMTSSGMDLTQLSSLYLGTTVNNGANITSNLSVGNWVDIAPQVGGIFGTGGNLYGAIDRIMSKQVRLLAITNGNPNGSLTVRYRICPYI